MKLEKGVPLPRMRAKRGFYDFVKEMKPGDSIVVEGLARNSVTYRGRGLGYKMTSQKIDDKHYRIWRVE